MRIVFVNTLYSPNCIGGAEVSLQELSESLVSLGCEVIVVTLAGGKGRATREVINGVEVVRAPLINIYWPYDNKRRSAVFRVLWHFLDILNVPMAFLVWRVLRRAKADVVCTNNIAGFSTLCWAVVASMRTPLIHVSRDYYLLHPSAKKIGSKKLRSVSDVVLRCLLVPKRALSRLASGYVAISNYVLSVHHEAGFFSAAHSAVIYNPVSVVDGVENRVRFPVERIVFGYMGRLDPSKGIELMLEALSKTGFDCQLLIAGEGDRDYVESLKQRFSGQHIVWLGRRERSEFYPLIDCLIVPSVWPEPFGRVVIEANSYGKPVISSDAGGLREIVRENITGFQFEAGSVSSLENAVQRYYVGRGGLSAEECVVYSKKFNSISVARQYLSFFGRVLGA